TSRGQRRPVSCAFELSGNRVSFRLGSYDPALPLVIDPTVLFNSYSGANTVNWGMAGTYDSQGNLYSTGGVFDMTFPRTTGAYTQPFGGNGDVGVHKYNPSGRGAAALLYGTYIGGLNPELPHSVWVNPQDELLILCSTGSSDFPTTAGAYDRTFNGGSFINPNGVFTYSNGSDLGIIKFSSTGALQASTFLGGSGNDGIMGPFNQGSFPLLRNYGDQFRGDLTTDPAGNVYIASLTASTNFPTPGGAATTYRGGVTDGVVCKLSANLGSLIWGTYLGGSGSDAAFSLQLGSTGSVYVAGGTTSPNFPVTPGTLQPNLAGDVDGYVARLSSSGNLVERATYLGTGLYDQAYFISLDAADNPYLLGQTRGAWPVTTGTYRNVGGKQFIHKLNADLTSTGFSTVFGSGGASPDISPVAFQVDDCGRILVSGWGGDASFGGTLPNLSGMPISPNATKPTTDGLDFYFLQLGANAATLDYGSYFGSTTTGEHLDGGMSRFDKKGTLYQTQCGGCGGTNFPIQPTAGYYQLSNITGFFCNQTTLKIDFGTGSVSAGPGQTVCSNAAPITLTGAFPAGGVWSGPGVTQVGGAYVFTPSAALVGNQTLTYTLPGQPICSGTATRVIVVQAVTAASFGPLDPAFCISQTTGTPLTASPPGGTFSGPGVAGNLFYPAAAGLGTHTITYALPTTPCAPASTVTRTVQVSNSLTISLRQDTAICQGNIVPILLGGALPTGGVWSGVGVSQQGSRYVFTPPATPGSYALTYAT
ncbi:hypothetical protein LJY25_21125, partial [Hymenobacter sp. BT175]|nr:hypothetical protein [Hymenobacter translucens]